jgi:hypothetical protein
VAEPWTLNKLAATMAAVISGVFSLKNLYEYA